MSISAEIIVKTALELLKAQGIENLSLRKLQAELQVSAPTIYWRYKSKQQLIEAMSEFIINERLDTSAVSDASWQEWLRHVLLELRTAILTYRDGAQIVSAAGLIGTPSLAGLTDEGLRRMQQAGVEESQASLILFACLHYALGHIAEEQNAMNIEKNDQRKFLSQYPYLQAAVARKRQDKINPEIVYRRGIDLLLRA